MEKRQEIMKRVQEHYDEAVARGYNVAFVSLQGSQNYGLDLYTDTYMSDVDTKAVVIPTLEDIASGAAPASTTIVLENNEHIDIKDIRMMKEMFLKQNISYLEVLFTEYVVVNPLYEELIGDLFENADILAEANHIAFYKAIKGMALEKLKALKHPYPTTMAKIEKFGYDPKQLHHIERLREMVNRLYLGESLREVFMSNETEYLLEVKVGKYDLEEAEAMAEQSIEEISMLCDGLAAQDKPIESYAKVYLNHLITELLKVSIRQELEK